LEQLVRVCKEEGLIGVLGFNLMTENTGFIDELIRLGTENEAVTKWIDNFYSQVNSSTMVEERNRSLAQICNWTNDMAQLVQIELLKEIHEELNSGNKNRPKVQDQLCRIEKKVTEAFSNNELAKSFLEKVKAPNSKEFLRSHLFPKILLEKVTNVNQNPYHGAPSLTRKCKIVTNSTFKLDNLNSTLFNSTFNKLEFLNILGKIRLGLTRSI
jgi:hypothetical protein